MRDLKYWVLGIILGTTLIIAASVAGQACAYGDCFGRRCLNGANCCMESPTCVHPAGRIGWGHCQ